MFMCFVWFKSYWKWVVDAGAERKTADESPRLNLIGLDPLLGVQSSWKAWFQYEATKGQKDEIAALDTDLIEQSRFITWVEQWAEWLPYKQVGYLVLIQLAQEAPFKSWDAFQPYYNLENLQGFHAVILQKAVGGSRNDVSPLSNFAIPKQQSDGVYLLKNFYAIDSAPNAFTNVKEAVQSVLQRTSLGLLLLLWGVFGRKLRYRWVMLLLTTGWAIVAVLLLLLLSPVTNQFFADDGRLIPTLYVLILLARLLALYSLLGICLEGVRAWVQGRKWAKRLQESQLCVVFGSVLIGTPPLRVGSPSFGLALYLNTLLALHETSLVTSERPWLRSRLWGQFFDHLEKKLSTWAVVGEVTGWGWIKHADRRDQSNRVDDKVEALLDHPRIADALMAVPAIRDYLREVFQCLFVRVNNQLFPGRKKNSSRISQRRQPDAVEPQLRLHHCWHSTQAILIIGEFFNLWSIAGGILVLVMCATIFVARSDINSLINPPQIAFIHYQIIIPENENERRDIKHVLLTFRTTDINAYKVYVSSDFYNNRMVDLVPSDAGPESANALIELKKRQGARGKPLVNVEVQRTRKLLGFNLPPKIVLWWPSKVLSSQ